MNESFILKVTIYKEFMTVTPYCIGIDLGNQNCVIFQAGGKNRGAVPLIYNQRRIFPTKTAFSTNPWREYACEEAERQEEFNPMGTLSDLKLLLSQSFGRFDKKKFPNINQEIISEKNEALKFKIQFKDGYQQIPIQQALAVIFTRIIEICKSEIPDIDLDTTTFVICVSPSWGVAERIIILEAAKKIAGMKNVRLLNSTTAETICYYFKFLRKELFNKKEQNQDGNSETEDTYSKNLGVADVGDSSINISITSIEAKTNDGKIKPHITFQNTKLNTFDIGGRDFTNVMVNYIKNSIEKNETKNQIQITGASSITIEQIENNKNANDKLFKAAEELKRKMRISDTVKFQQYNILPGVDIEMLLLREDYLEECNIYINNLKNDIENCKTIVDYFQCSGGSLRLQSILNLFNQTFNNENFSLSQLLNPEECFAEGAAYYGLSEMNLLINKFEIHDIIPYDISVSYIGTDKTQQIYYKFYQGKTNTIYYFSTDSNQPNQGIIFIQDQQINIGTLNLTLSNDIAYPLKINYTFNENGLLSILSCQDKYDKSITFEYSERKFISDDDIGKIKNSSNQSQNSKENQNKKEDEEYKICTLINDISNSIDGNGPYSPYIANVNEYDKEKIKNFKQTNWSEYSVKDIQENYQTILKDYPFISLKEKYDEINNQISSKRLEAKQYLNDFIKKNSGKIKEASKRLEAKQYLNDFYQTARTIRKEFEDSSKTDEPSGKYVEDLDEALGKFKTNIDGLLE